MHIHVCPCMFMYAHAGMPSGGQGITKVICSPFPPYFLLFFTSSGILNGFIVIVVFDFCMYSRLADP